MGEQEFDDAFGNPDFVVSVDDVDGGVNLIVSFLNHYQEIVRKSNFQSVDPVVKNKINETLKIGRYFRDVTDRSTKINLQSSAYAGDVSFYLDDLSKNRFTGQELADAMGDLLGLANEILKKTEDISKEYDSISERLQKISSEIVRRGKDLENQKRQVNNYIDDKKERENMHKKGRNAAAIGTAAASGLFWPALPLTLGLLAYKSHKMKNTHNKIEKAEEEYNAIEKSLKFVDDFKYGIDKIRTAVGHFVTFWRGQTEKVENLVRSSKNNQGPTTLSRPRANKIIRDWKIVETRYREYNRVISDGLGNYLMV
ncbi:31800_t:CDS:1 [Gigaspora margarita]|uniref:31800_t:CDS:1 n=1 Tax=Gigaspora margarita TaxID=4874 RepID=A0ABN7UI35_GIGMA|nr:31800_t:CDS:1 [Gigaspora margarita]